MKKILAGLLAILLLCALAGCAPGQHDGLYEDNAAIAGKDRTAVFSFAGNQQAGNQYSFTVESVSGARTIWHHTAAAGREVTLGYTLRETKNGDAKLALVAPSGSVVVLAQASARTEEGSHTFVAEEGTYYLKLVGRNGAGAQASLTYTHGEIGQGSNGT